MKNKTFKENLNTAVITTKYVLEEQSPILFVYHFSDGFWQFSGSEENLSTKDYKLISLEEIIEIDPTVLEVADLPHDKEAYRKDVLSRWTIR